MSLKLTPHSKAHEDHFKNKIHLGRRFTPARTLTDEERMVWDAVTAYAQDKLKPRVVNAFRNESTDPDIFKEMGAQGLLGAMIAP